MFAAHWGLRDQEDMAPILREPPVSSDRNATCTNDNDARQSVSSALGIPPAHTEHRFVLFTPRTLSMGRHRPRGFNPIDSVTTPTTSPSPEWKAGILGVPPPHGTCPAGHHPASLIFSASLLPAQSLVLNGFCPHLRLTPTFYHFHLLNISRVHVLLSSSLARAPEWLWAALPPQNRCHSLP